MPNGTVGCGGVAVAHLPALPCCGSGALFFHAKRVANGIIAVGIVYDSISLSIFFYNHPHVVAIFLSTR